MNGPGEGVRAVSIVRTPSLPSPPPTLPPCQHCNEPASVMLAAFARTVHTRKVPCGPCFKTQAIIDGGRWRRMGLKCFCEHMRAVGLVQCLPCLECRSRPLPVCPCKDQRALDGGKAFCTWCDPKNYRRKYDHCQCARMKPLEWTDETGSISVMYCPGCWLKWATLAGNWIYKLQSMKHTHRAALHGPSLLVYRSTMQVGAVASHVSSIFEASPARRRAVVTVVDGALSVRVRLNDE